MHKTTKQLVKFLATRALFYGFFMFLALNVKIFWLSAGFFVAFSAFFIMELYLRYHYTYSKSEEKRRIISQKPLNRYFYDRWYAPADSTELEYEANKLRKKKKPA
jgi:hypothetical protein